MNIFLRLFLPKGTCQNCSRKGKGKCKIEIRCISKRKVRKDRGIKRIKKVVG